MHKFSEYLDLLLFNGLSIGSKNWKAMCTQKSFVETFALVRRTFYKENEPPWC